MKNVSVWSQSRLEPPFFALSRSRPNLVGAVVGPGTSDFRSRSRPKKWPLRNTAFDIHHCCGAGPILTSSGSGYRLRLRITTLL